MLKKILILIKNYKLSATKLKNSYKLFFKINFRQILTNKALIYNHFLHLSKLFNSVFSQALVLNKKAWRK